MVRHGGGLRKFGKPKLKERERAIELRREGKTYSEILKEVPVAKSTLSVWLGEVGLTKKQEQRITEKRRAAMARGAAARRRQRIENTQEIIEKAKKGIRNISKRELWLIGTALYWAEGAKEKEAVTRNAQVDFANTDRRMVALFLKWLTVCCQVNIGDISFSVYIHENHGHALEDVVKYWSSDTGIPKNALGKFYFKKHNPKTNRKNTGKGYYGILRMRVRSSSSLGRKIAGWTQGIVEQSGIV